LPSLTAVSNTPEDVFFTLASDWGSAFPGQNVNYVIAVRNNKTTQLLRTVVIAITLPANLELTDKPRSDRGDPQLNGNRVTLQLNDLAPGQTVELSIPAKIKTGVAVDTRIVSQAELTFEGLKTLLYSNIASVLVVGQAAQPTATMPPTATTQPSATTQAAVAATATLTLAPNVQAAAPTQAVASTAVASAQIQPARSAPALPDTSSGVPISGMALLGMTLFIRTVRLHRAQSRI
jgi:hypothetical protein